MQHLRCFVAALFACALFAAPGTVKAQSAHSAAHFVLVPYQEPGEDDPHAAVVTQVLSDGLKAAGVSFTTVDPVAHLDAVANAAKLCVANNATALLIPDGRYEQTSKRLAVSFVVVVKYNTHVEFRLDQVSCSGFVQWSNVATGDQTQSGMYTAGNVGAAVDAAFRDAVQSDTAAFASASIWMELS